MRSDAEGRAGDEVVSAHDERDGSSPILSAMTTEPRRAIAYPPSGDPPIDLGQVVALRDFEAPARERLHPAAWAYYAGGAGDEHTLRPRSRPGTRSGSGPASWWTRHRRPVHDDPRQAGRPPVGWRPRRCTAWPTLTARRRPRERQPPPARSTSSPRRPRTRSRMSPRPRPTGVAGSSSTSSATGRSVASSSTGRGGRLRGDLPDRRPAGPWLPRRGLPPRFDPGEDAYANLPSAALARHRPTWTTTSTCGASGSPGMSSRRSGRGRRCRSCSRGS